MSLKDHKEHNLLANFLLEAVSRATSANSPSLKETFITKRWLVDKPAAIGVKLHSGLICFICINWYSFDFAISRVQLPSISIFPCTTVCVLLSTSSLAASILEYKTAFAKF
uniref:Uncharacterized protein n=1 Tax=Glossina brevipalpis TaxID=37001 RepID=A0A1A9VZT1_9MUSC